ncbi:uncharacterized protein LOC131642613 [Vicia villosa]|uniref:uncharacterized protein LOC131642613 n=1 Tax=Vicia villosa TaxID=3911 RepID=UPI00273CF3A9|nr:uncharacterized protein LOC131642613 [Vicia villosa]
MASSSTTSTKVTLKLLVDTKKNKVVFAEASKPAIDSLLNMFRLSFGTTAKLMSNNNMHLLGCLENLYHTSSTTTLQNINHNHVLLNSTTPNNNIQTSFFTCQNGCPYDVTLSCDVNAIPCCCLCLTQMIHQETSGVVAMKDQNATFMLMDDLVIQPISPISIITLLNKFNIKNIDTLQEIVVEFGRNECVELLKASLQSKMVLTNVFIKKKNKGFSMFKSMAILYFSLLVLGFIVNTTPRYLGEEC